MTAKSLNLAVCLCALVACDVGDQASTYEDRDAHGKGDAASEGDEASGDEGGAEDDGGGAEPDPVVGGELHAFAIRYGDLPPLESDSGGEGDSGSYDGGGTEIDPDTLVVVVGTGNASCDDPRGTATCDYWEVSVHLAPDTQPGVYSLWEDLHATGIVGGPVRDDNSCWGGGGSLDGTLTLSSISEDAVVGEISGVSPFDFDPNGEFTATICDFSVSPVE